MSRPRFGAFLSLTLIAVGTASSGHGMWIFAKARLAQLLLERAWRRTEIVGPGVAPWPWADTWPVARLAAPVLGVDLIVLAGGSGRTMAFGPGHLDASAAPGAPGNCVLVGHRDTHFAFLANLEPGDELVLETPDRRVVSYRVTATDVVHADDTWVTEPLGGSELTLVTCYPFHTPVPGGSLRFVVRARAGESRRRILGISGMVSGTLERVVSPAHSCPESTPTRALRACPRGGG